VLNFSQAHYPETLGMLFVVNAPWVFKAAFAVFKPFLSEFTVKKMHVLGSDYREVLLRHIDAESLPEFLGGKCKCGPGADGCCVPIPDPDAGKTKVKISSGKKHEAQVEVPGGHTLSWEFYMEKGADCNFGATFAPAAGGAAVQVVKLAKVEKPLVETTGEFKAPSQGELLWLRLWLGVVVVVAVAVAVADFASAPSGMVTLTWENDSWVYAKNLLFATEVTAASSGEEQKDETKESKP
jgi:hypothetical protein